METVVINEAIMDSVANTIKEELGRNNRPHDPKDCSVCNITESLVEYVEPVSLLFEVATDAQPQLALLKLLSIYILIGIRYSQALQEVAELEELERLERRVSE